MTLGHGQGITFRLDFADILQTLIAAGIAGVVALLLQTQDQVIQTREDVEVLKAQMQSFTQSEEFVELRAATDLYRSRLEKLELKVEQIQTLLQGQSFKSLSMEPQGVQLRI